MFFRTKTSGPRTYLQIVENRWEDGRPRQRVLATLGRLDHLQQTGQLDALLASGARLSRSVLLLSEHARGQLPTITTRRIGPALTHLLQLRLGFRRNSFGDGPRIASERQT
jgi:hypothetical protein